MSVRAAIKVTVHIERTEKRRRKIPNTNRNFLVFFDESEHACSGAQPTVQQTTRKGRVRVAISKHSYVDIYVDIVNDYRRLGPAGQK